MHNGSLLIRRSPIDTVMYGVASPRTCLFTTGEFDMLTDTECLGTQCSQGGAAGRGWRQWLFVALFATVAWAASPGSAHAADLARSPVCQSLQAQYPEFKGKTLVDAINPHTPGYEALDPKDPSHYVGFDIDLAEALGSCLGFSLKYTPVAFAALLPTLQSGQADLVISDIYATKERAKAADFITYSKVFDGVLVAKGNPKRITGINLSMCGTTAAENTGFVEVPLVQNLAEPCKAAGKPAPQLQLYDNNAACIQAILAGRADTYINDVNTVDQAVKAYPDKLSKAVAVTLPYHIGIGVSKSNPKLRDAIVLALGEIQKSGAQLAMMKKWGLDQGAIEPPIVISDK
ncbi:ABC transporter substrate-binding protein [Thiomonas sp. X19]|uniref:ABC transporter substrate-binding protein n=1 Tax=Thiomonas sp. X19 TaxID=1050370 RepID=UPI001E30D127|nr:ABC transporter substrate-binding protein [Thiomonas sp. X19]